MAWIKQLGTKLWLAVRHVAAERGIPSLVGGLLLVLPMIAAVGLAIAAPHPRLYHFLVDEDHLLEWSQFVVLVAASGVFAIAALRARRADRQRVTVMFGVVAIVALVVAAEKISWASGSSTGRRRPHSWT